MPMDWKRYPANWKEIALEVKASAERWCAGCGKKCREPGEKLDTHQRTLTVHHIYHNPENCKGENLIAVRAVPPAGGRAASCGDQEEKEGE